MDGTRLHVRVRHLKRIWRIFVHRLQLQSKNLQVSFHCILSVAFFRLHLAKAHQS